MMDGISVTFVHLEHFQMELKIVQNVVQDGTLSKELDIV
jgi:hypothetical protein